MKNSTRLAALIASSAVVLAACSSADPLENSDGSESPAAADAIVIGSQDYYSNEIIAEIYAQSLEAEGFEVDRQFRIGQREV